MVLTKGKARYLGRACPAARRGRHFRPPVGGLAYATTSGRRVATSASPPSRRGAGV